MPMGRQEYCAVLRGFSGVHWVWCNGRGPHLELRWEPQGSSPFLTLITGSLQSWNRRVKPSLVLRNGTPLASPVVLGVTGHLSSCIWNLGGFPNDATGVSVPLRVVTSSSVLHWKKGPSIGTYLESKGKSVSFEMCNDHGVPLEFQCESGLPLRCDGKVGIPFQTKQGNRPSCRDQEGRKDSD